MLIDNFDEGLRIFQSTAIFVLFGLDLQARTTNRLSRFISKEEIHEKKFKSNNDIECFLASKVSACCGFLKVMNSFPKTYSK